MTTSSILRYIISFLIVHCLIPLQALKDLLEDDQKFGFIVIDGNGSLFGTLSGNTREVIHKFLVDLPKKHGRGGQSALRFARYDIYLFIYLLLLLLLLLLLVD